MKKLPKLNLKKLLKLNSLIKTIKRQLLRWKKRYKTLRRRRKRLRKRRSLKFNRNLIRKRKKYRIKKLKCYHRSKMISSSKKICKINRTNETSTRLLTSSIWMMALIQKVNRQASELIHRIVNSKSKK